MSETISPRRQAVELLKAFVEGSVTAGEVVDLWPPEHRDRLLDEVLFEFRTAGPDASDADLKRTAQIAIQATEGEWVPEAFHNALETDVPRSVAARRSFAVQVAVGAAAIAVLVVLLAVVLTRPANRFNRAVREGDVARVRELLEAHPEFLEAEDRYGLTPIQRAVYGDDAELVRFLIAKGADAGPRADGDMTLLHMAALSGSARVAEVLLAEGADVNARTRDGRTPLHLAARAGRKEMIELLLAHGADVNAEDDSGETALSLSVEWGHEEVAGLLRTHGAED